MFRPFASLIVCIACVFGPGFAEAANPRAHAELSLAEKAYTSLDFSQAKALAEKLREGGGLDHEQLQRATRVWALSSAALDKNDLARDAFTLLLAYDPDYKLDAKLSPKFQEPFAEARGYWKAQAKRPGVEATASLHVGSLGAIRVQTRDPSEIAVRVSVGYRWAPAREYTVGAARLGDTQVDVAVAPAGSTRLDYYVQVFDAKDNIVFEDGNPESPRTAIALAEPTTARKADKSIFASTWFWVAGAAILTAGGVGTYFAVRPTQSDPTAFRASGVAVCGGTPCN
jgi:hypothetical protein